MAKLTMYAVFTVAAIAALSAVPSAMAQTKFTSYPNGVWTRTTPIIQLVSFTLKDKTKAPTFIALRVQAINAVLAKNPGIIQTYQYFKAFVPSNTAPAPGLTFGDAGGILTFSNIANYNNYQSLVKLQKAYSDANLLIKTTTRAISVQT